MANQEYSANGNDSIWRSLLDPVKAGAGAPPSYGGMGGGDALSAQALMQALQDPTIKALLAEVMKQIASGKGTSGDPFAEFNKDEAPRMMDSTPPGIWGDKPSYGPVQWLGGMPPGYNDDVAKKIAIGANVGNVMAGGGGALLKALIGGIFNGARGR